MHTVPRPLDVVALMADLPSRGLRRGQVGTVVQILGGACKVSSRTTTAAFALAALAPEQLLVLHYRPTGLHRRA